MPALRTCKRATYLQNAGTLRRRGRRRRGKCERACCTQDRLCFRQPSERTLDIRGRSDLVCLGSDVRAHGGVERLGPDRVVGVVECQSAVAVHVLEVGRPADGWVAQNVIGSPIGPAGGAGDGVRSGWSAPLTTMPAQTAHDSSSHGSRPWSLPTRPKKYECASSWVTTVGASLSGSISAIKNPPGNSKPLPSAGSSTVTHTSGYGNGPSIFSSAASDFAMAADQTCGVTTVDGGVARCTDTSPSCWLRTVKSPSATDTSRTAGAEKL